MALDEKLMDWHREGKIPPAIRFYEWDPATLSLGYFQRVERDIDLEAVKRHEVGFIRRPTGGRAVLHEDELTYSIIVSEDHEGIPLHVTEAYRVLSEGLLVGFRDLGLDAEFSIPRTQEERDALKNPRSAVCFDAPSWYEMVVAGRKIAGSAQTRQNGVVLQHGSIIRSINEEKLFDMFKFKNERLRQRMQEGFKKKATPICDLLEVTPSISVMKQAFRDGFERALNISLVDYALTREQEDEVHHLAEKKYRSDAWTYKY
ncbi:lipoate--protein ligase family protein [Paenalkalicoccus suaedae]|uniref:Lipoate--protein ligase family protein n=1 Tax=Paenalkalicoccus suaedae TaxID=2592382 RepID=A0A859FK87_9BACI|nr:biotin/lipoate A/B protein ligase family protein [Paenalkalicoccus suaedae]QKS73214.1 lipoate--protein ligase family protein [Paenalkalicoccus suaedae]